MGNSNSSTVQVGHHPSKWSGERIDILPSDHRNRMKKGYFPPKHQLAHQIAQPQHLVLPKNVNPNELSLKPTSNGAILHGGGTISGRKILNELDICTSNTNERKKNGNLKGNPFCENNGIAGLSTPNLSSLTETLDEEDSDSHHKEQNRRGYESDPDFKLTSYNSMTIEDESTDETDNRHRQESVQPKSLSMISESPTKKQIRCKKKSQAPTPPMATNRMAVGDGIFVEAYTKFSDPQRQASECHDKYGRKKLNRLFKTKGQNKCNGDVNNSNNARTDNCGEWEQMVKRKGEVNIEDYSFEDQNQNKLLYKMNEQQQLTNMKTGYSKSADKSDFCRIESGASSTMPDKNKRCVTSSCTVPVPLCSSSATKGAKKMKEEEQSSSSLPSSRHDSVDIPREAISGRAPVPINNKSNNNISDKTEPSLRIDIDKKIERHSHDSNFNKNLESASPIKTYEMQKRTFYFGMEEDSTNTMRIKCTSNNNKTKSNGVFNNSVPSKSSVSSSSSLTRSTNHSNSHAVKDKASSSAQSKESNNIAAKSSTNNLQANNRCSDIFGKRENRPLSNFLGKKSRNKMFENQFTFDEEASSLHAKSERLNVGGVNKKSGQGYSEYDQFEDKTLNTNKMGQRSSSPSSSHSPIPKATYTKESLSPIKKKNKGNKSESDSDGIHHRQDSGNFDDFNERSDEAKRIRYVPSNGAFVHNTIHETSSSDLSSSEIDIPLVLRPTLPQKRRELSRFSPSAAWRALDSPAVSGRSLSSEEGFTNYEDGIQRYNTRPIAPSRSGGLNERSGDSGISAGDSPAIPDIVIPPQTVSHKYYSPCNQKDGKSVEETKCWTPQQDLDESSSEFDENDFIDKVPSISTNLRPNVLANTKGPRTPPKLTTKKNFFFKTNSTMNNNNYSDSEIIKQHKNVRNNEQFITTSAGESPMKQSLYTRSANVKNHKNFDPNAKEDVDFLIHSNNKPSLRRIANHHRGGGANYIQRKGFGGGGGGKDQRKNNDEFVGLDTNWFLSRSEPNSLNNLRMMSSHQQPVNFILNGDKHELFDDQKRGRGDGDDNDDGESENNDDFVHPDYDDGYDRFGCLNSLNREVRSEIGYGPSSLNSYYYCHSYAGKNSRRDYHDENEEAFGLHRPFSKHIIYLPSYESRRNYTSSQYYGDTSNRRAKSVDNLDSVNVLFKPKSQGNYYEPRRDFADGYGDTDEMKSCGKLSTSFACSDTLKNRKMDESEPLNMRAVKNSTNFEEQCKRKKFKFQSTLRVLERKQLERKLAQEAEQKELERLHEIEAMKQVEEEFQRKRAKEKLENQFNNENTTDKNNNNEGGIITITPWDTKHANRNISTSRTTTSENRVNIGHPSSVEAKPINTNLKGKSKMASSINGGTTVLSITNSNKNSKGMLNGSKQSLTPKSSSSSSNNSTSHTSSSISNERQSNTAGTQIVSQQRLEPEGAPSSSAATTPNDLRRELILASKKRSGTNSSLSSSTDPLSTHELSEYKQETRQYWDYCRKTPQNAGKYYQQRGQGKHSSKNRAGGSSSDIYPLSKGSDKGKSRSNPSTMTIVHAEVICDIPAKPISYKKRLSGSASNILDDRSSLTGGNSAASSVISDNYRKDWVHKNSGGGSIIHIVGSSSPARKSSSIVSLHSSPRYTSSSDNFRHSKSDISMPNNGHGTDNLDSSHVAPKRKSPASQKFMNAKTSQFSFVAGQKSSRGNGNKNHNIEHNVFQPQPFTGCKNKEFRPVVFKPTSFSESGISRQNFTSLT